MKGYRFYLEYANPAMKRKGIHEGNVIAAMPENSWLECNHQWPTLKESDENKVFWMVETVSALLFQPDSPVCGSNAAWDYIHKNCKRISEKQARVIHPALFAYLDRPD